MAPVAGSSHTFQKLKLDTSAPHKPVAASTFASISRHDSQQHDPEPLSPDVDGLSSTEHPIYADAGARKHDDDGPVTLPVPYHSGSDGAGDVEAQFRERNTSISFDSEVTLETGHRLSIEEPLPKSTAASSLTETSDGEDSSEEGYIEITVDRRKRLQHHAGESRYPLLQSTVDELAKDSEYQDHVASLTSETTASSVLEEVYTPSEIQSEYLLSPIPATSPIEFPPYPSRRNLPQRSKSYRSDFDGEGSLRRSSRRSSNRSGRSLSSMSPAASFLARYKAAETPLKPTEPDDEGQGIGYHSEYIIGKQIGFGGFSVVKEVTTIENGRKAVHAVKIVRKQLKGKSELENEELQTQFDHEVEIWRFLRHSYISPLLRVYNTDFATFCITRLNKGGTLFDLVRDIRRRKQRGLAAPLARRYTYQLASAIRYLHNDVLVVHRDVKLENCLLDMTVPNAEQGGGDVLLCDFGMADFIVSDQRDGVEPHSMGENQNIGPADTSTSIQGSLQYAAPELFNASGPIFSPAADIWAFGVVVYALLTAQLPFNAGLDSKTMFNIRNGHYDIETLRDTESAKTGGIDDAIELIQGCLHMRTGRRWTIHDVLDCRWLGGCAQVYEDVPRSWLTDS